MSVSYARIAAIGTPHHKIPVPDKKPALTQQHVSEIAPKVVPSVTSDTPNTVPGISKESSMQITKEEDPIILCSDKSTDPERLEKAKKTKTMDRSQTLADIQDVETTKEERKKNKSKEMTDATEVVDIQTDTAAGIAEAVL
jgi:hypothetical protein